ncbi:MAG: AI-2E family transporter [Cellulosilyticum sp.]|nr:AI-2E family transporter [Cellulosilyticum sp.]
MKSFWKDNQYFKISLYAIFVVVVAILFYRFSSNTDNIAPSIIAFLGSIVKIILPILYGLLIAYLFNPIMIFFEGYFIKWLKPKSIKAKKIIRTLAIVSVYLCIIGTIILMIRYLIPQISENIRDLLVAVPNYTEQLSNHIANIEDTINSSVATLPYALDTSKLFDMIDPHRFLNADMLDSLVSGIMDSAVSITSSFYNWIMALVIAFYMLTQKEDFARGGKKLIYSLLRKDHAEKVVALCAEGNAIFIQFFVGKFIDSTIIGIICFIGLSILRNPYALLLSVIVGVFNMIPYFGPILGAIPAIIITLFTGFMPAVFVAIFILILQQFDGLVLGPKILGDSIGLSPFWIISGILIGGALWGPLGMFFASPLVAVILNNINRWIDKRLHERNISDEFIETPHPYSIQANSNSKLLYSKKKKSTSSK